ncbi:PAP2-domain-containing protein [Conidiobolus coronatus NRRL 28638]|uniref:PAP2-domain-containing protein n=1 Tax=Conidiobolus coronatus (strain ATCC 28846 / CBS 209.66 / NRRL 28638) TaxID=796925 RepID=A0A137PBZ2_CONC2|nr:PAP2-domain-containing protein [Conidiobolus coronatus NRRL 28638]|eukprot:KXN72485.1 PAP2-domain-containing protein [Conidiobolus coronatus NRRL 28638]
MSKFTRIINWSPVQLAFDWIGCFGLIYLIYLIESTTTPFKHREFLLNDTNIGHPFTVEEIVPNKALLWLCFGGPIIILLASYLKVRNWKFVHIAIIGLFFNLALGAFIIQLLKNLVGRLRPDFIDRCIPNEASLGSTLLLTLDICTQTNPWTLRDGTQSFPSGHAANTFGSLLFLALYFNLIFQLKNSRFKWLQYYCFILPLSISLYVGISRIWDFRHHWEDVLVGSCIGIFTGLFSYFYYFKKIINHYDDKDSEVQENKYELVDSMEN